MNHIEKLNDIRVYSGDRATVGLSEEVIQSFLVSDPSLGKAIDSAHKLHLSFREEFSEFLKLDETSQISQAQEGIVNFYAEDAINPYVSISASGPWIVTTCGAVIHDSGGYGMLGFGHSPEGILSAMGGDQVMANIMTANLSQKKLVKMLKKEIGAVSNRSGLYTNFLFMNSGSESVTVASRLSDINARNQTKAGGKHEGKTPKFLALEGGFHGRTDRPAQISDSCLKKYKETLSSFSERDNLVTVKPNDLGGLSAAFEKAKIDGIFFESFFMEPVMGEGDPGKAITPEFYSLARKLTFENDALFLVDSIQAGLRTHGCLSILDYPGFESEQAPDMETFSKALNAGQYPLSVLAMTDRSAALYVRGVYGNTMTANPRAMDVACSVLGMVDSTLRSNIQERGTEFLEKLEAVSKKFPGLVTKIQGTGLLFSAEIDSKVFEIVGDNGLEKYLRKKGMGVIHGGENSLRFTPHFRITSKEVDLMMDLLVESLENGPKLV